MAKHILSISVWWEEEADRLEVKTLQAKLKIPPEALQKHSKLR